MTIAQWLVEVAARDPDRVAVIVEDRRIAFSELVRDMDRLALWFDRQGLGPGDVVGLSVSDNYEHLVAYLALFRLGCPQVCLATFDPAEMRAGVARQCEVSAIVAESAALALPDRPVLVPDFAALLSDSPAQAGVLPTPDPDEVALLLPSSGTTGRPKIVPASQSQLLVMAPRYWEIATGMTGYFAASMEFGPARRHNLGTLILGRTVIMARKRELARPDRVCHELSVGMLSLNNMQARSLIDAAGGEASPLLPPETVFRVGGSALEPRLRDDILRIVTPNLYAAYGATEVYRISVAGPELHRQGHTGVGRPLSDTAVEILDDDGNPLPAGRVGQVRVRTPGMATGYYRDPEQTARAFRDGWYHTGDMGVLSEDGLLYLEGRIDDMMSLNSVNVFPREIETVIDSFPGVLECAAFPVRSPIHGDIPMAAVKAVPGTDLHALHLHCRAKLGIRAPRKLLAVSALPRNDAGKVVRRELARLFDPRRENAKTPVGTEQEKP